MEDEILLLLYGGSIVSTARLMAFSAFFYVVPGSLEFRFWMPPPEDHGKTNIQNLQACNLPNSKTNRSDL